MRENLPPKEYFLNKPIPGSTYTIQDFVDSGNNAHVFKAFSGEFQHTTACKVIPKANLKSNWKDEITHANTIRSGIVVRFHAAYEWTDPVQGIECVVICWEFVPGQSLKNYLRKNPKNVDVHFAVTFLEQMLELFRELQLRKIPHGDLHTGNVLIEDRAGSLIGPPYAFRVTDFGVTSAISDSVFKDDFDQLALIVREILLAVDYSGASSLDRFTFDILNVEFVGKHLVERDTAHDPAARNPAQLFSELKKVEARYQTELRERIGAGKLTAPFDYLSCEQIGESHSVLQALYSEKFLGLAEIESRNNLVLTGPRGCGKSTVFKSLSLNHRTTVGSSAPENLKYLGVYYRCDDLYFTFPRYKLPSREEAWDLPVHYVTSSLLSALLESLADWARVHLPSDLERLEQKAAEALWSILRIDPPASPDRDTFKAIAVRLQKERRRAAEKQRFSNDPKHTFGYYFGPEVLVKACDALRENLPFVHGLPFYFFIDDYSAPKVTKPLQENLNRLFMQRTASCFFKLSTESPVSYSRSDIDAKTYVEGREFDLLNLGLVFIHAETESKLRFIEDVFSRRLTAVDGYPVKSLDDLVGNESEINHNETARKIRDGKKPEVYGKTAIVNLCSGDIHYIIGLVSQMVTTTGGAEALAKSDRIPKVETKIQNKAVRDQAGNFLKNLRGIQANGDQLVAVVTAFGNVASSHLKFRNSKNEAGEPPHQASRIEPYEDLSLSAQARDIYNELLRYSVFIEDMRGKSRRGKVVPRLYLRRFLIPHFNLTFSGRDSLELEPHAVEELLLRPQDFENKYRLKNPSDTLKSPSDTLQRSLLEQTEINGNDPQS